MYEAAVDFWESRGSEFGPEGVAHLGVITALKKICNHPSLLKRRHSRDHEPGEVSNWLILHLSLHHNLGSSMSSAFHPKYASLSQMATFLRLLPPT